MTFLYPARAKQASAAGGPAKSGEIAALLPESSGC
jgi:hypothetical protein